MIKSEFVFCKSLMLYNRLILKANNVGSLRKTMKEIQMQA